MATLSTALRAFWAILTSSEKATAWNALHTPALPPAEPEQPAEPAAAEAVHLLAILQREARLVDFLQEDISNADDEQIGAAVRKIHDDARDVLQKCFDIAPILPEEEGTTVTIPEAFDNRAIRLTGKLTAPPPFEATLIHRGWKVRRISLPQTSAAVDPAVIAPAEVERL